MLYDECDGLPFLGPNDIVFDADGGFWFTDFGKTRARARATAAGCTTRASTAPTSRCVAPGLNGPNGVGLSPGGDRVYVAESYTGRLLAWDVTGPGEVKATQPDDRRARPRATSTPSRSTRRATSSSPRSPTGCASSRPTARATSTSRSPTPSTTNVCFGGDDLRTAYVTLSGGGRLVSFEWPRPGLALAF